MKTENLPPDQSPKIGGWREDGLHDPPDVPHNVRYLNSVSLPPRDLSKVPDLGHATLDAGVASHDLSAPQPGEVPASSAPARSKTPDTPSP